MTKIESLKSKSEFSEVSNKGKKYVTRYFIILVQKTDDKDTVFLGMKISKKIGNAVTRNKIRRRFKHLIRNLVKENTKFAGYRFLIIPKRSITSASYSALLQEVEKLD
jgi:ribonuclease P protein component